jgi:hypothetical protein
VALAKKLTRARVQQECTEPKRHTIFGLAADRMPGVPPLVRNSSKFAASPPCQSIVTRVALPR